MNPFISFCLRISLFLFTSLVLFAKPDSTEINIKVGFKDSETNLLADLINVEKITVSFSDSNLIGKKFMLSQVEYINGEKKEDKALIKCGKDTIKMVIGEDTVYHILSDLCDRATYQEDDTLFMIHFLCDNSEDSSARIQIKYPGFFFDYPLPKKEEIGYMLRDLFVCSDYKGMFPFNKKIPIITFAPPFDVGNGAKDYCILTNKPVEEWNKYYKLNHYVVFYLEIKD
ncbi:MAG: hypothetical protein A2X61_01720 [Ignavibacteria bacterium GWB2_35_12]|nr:MAG: hypothetical protein A2X61_01720 [Ignavibacteria bacterium GWB2_35_12]OGU92857.1 MAG: hypothetical protein A2220_14570 [Ignavibacteria bacterium RIFOXYA2_FULL_35_10]OGV19556.1 MAG: hypothetical protein A2475_07435 [Ignavibacteria bacterium RIFOXYC2_FULL_35_21]